MRVLIDESLPIELAAELTEFDVATVHSQGWLRLRNGVLLRAAVSGGFTAILTADTDLRHQQNLPKIGIGAVVVTNVRSRIEDLRPLLPRIIAALKTVSVGETTEVIGEPWHT